MKRPSLGTLVASLLALTAASGCQNTGNSVHDPGTNINDHWNADSLPPRIARFFLGYNAEKDGEYRDFAWERKRANEVFVRRYFLHLNPDNPFQSEDPKTFQPRPVNSPGPNPWTYIHFEGLAMGLGMLGWTGSFIPLPVDSIIGTAEPGGVDEFMAGLTRTAGPVGVVVSSFANTWIGPPLASSVTTFNDLVN